MCGVVGAFFQRIENAADVAEEINVKQRHRGPDSAHIHIGDWFALGHTRLAINGIGMAGEQPIASEDGRWLVVFNGEIYNHRELRGNFGLRTANQSDGAVIPELLSRFGVESLSLLRGMYAVIAVDLVQRKVIAAVDAMGIKPLHWCENHGNLVIASEPKAIAETLKQVRVDMDAIATFLHRGALDSDQSGIQDINRLVPGTWVEFSECELPKSGTIHPPEFGDQRPMDWEVVADAFEESVFAHLLSDVPIALLLSDGVDSTALAVAMARANADAIAITVDLGGASRSEAIGASATAAELGFRHVIASKETLRPFASDFFAHMNRPTIDGMNSFLVARAVRDAGVSVAITGIGGDEILSGYSTNKQIQAVRYLRKLPMAPRALASWAMKPSSSLHELRGRWESVGRESSVSAEEVFVGLQRQIQSKGWVAQATGISPARPSPLPYFETIGGQDSGARVMAAQASHYMSGQLLPDSDAFSMTHGVEFRVPFLDTYFINAVNSIRNRKLGKQDFVAALNSEILNRAFIRPKQGFQLPMNAWMESGELSEYVECLSESAQPINSLLEPVMINEQFEKWHRGGSRWPRVWSLAVLNEWMKGMSLA